MKNIFLYILICISANCKAQTIKVKDINGRTQDIYTASTMNLKLGAYATTTQMNSAIASSLSTSKAYTDLQVSNTVVGYKAADAIVTNNLKAYSDVGNALTIKQSNSYTDTSLLTIPELILWPDSGCKLVQLPDKSYTIIAEVIWDETTNKPIKNPKY